MRNDHGVLPGVSRNNPLPTLHGLDNTIAPPGAVATLNG